MIYTKIDIDTIGMKYIRQKYMEPHRCYHGWFHIKNMLQRLDYIEGKYKEANLEYGYRFDNVRMAVWLHDYVYDPFRTDNEEKSADYIKTFFPEINDYDYKVVYNLILATKVETDKQETKSGDQYLDECIHEIRHLDLMAFDTDDHLLPENFVKIMREYQRYPFSEFREGNLKVIDFILDAGYTTDSTQEWYTQWVKHYRPKIGIYAGSFNPFHIGHLSVLEQAERVFDKVIIMCPNKGKFHCDDLRKVLPFHEIICFEGLLIDQLKIHAEYADITLVRGLRDGNDLSYEINMHSINKDLGMDVPTMYFITNLPHISSTVVRDLKFTGRQKEFIPTKYDYYTGNENPYIVIPPEEK